MMGFPPEKKASWHINLSFPDKDLETHPTCGDHGKLKDTTPSISTRTWKLDLIKWIINHHLSSFIP